MAYKTWASGDVLTASDLNSFVVKTQSLYKVQAGTTAYTISSAAAANFTVTYGPTFATVIAFLITVKSSANVDLVGTQNGSPGLSTCSVRLAEKSGISGTYSGDIHWLVIGT